jgi:hypothetical protein
MITNDSATSFIEIGDYSNVNMRDSKNIVWFSDLGYAMEWQTPLTAYRVGKDAKLPNG